MDQWHTFEVVFSVYRAMPMDLMSCSEHKLGPPSSSYQLLTWLKWVRRYEFNHQLLLTFKTFFRLDWGSEQEGLFPKSLFYFSAAKPCRIAVNIKWWSITGWELSKLWCSMLWPGENVLTVTAVPSPVLTDAQEKKNGFFHIPQCCPCFWE